MRLSLAFLSTAFLWAAATAWPLRRSYASGASSYASGGKGGVATLYTSTYKDAACTTIDETAVYDPSKCATVLDKPTQAWKWTVKGGKYILKICVTAKCVPVSCVDVFSAPADGVGLDACTKMTTSQGNIGYVKYTSTKPANANLDQDCTSGKCTKIAAKPVGPGLCETWLGGRKTGSAIKCQVDGKPRLCQTTTTANSKGTSIVASSCDISNACSAVMPTVDPVFDQDTLKDGDCKLYQNSEGYKVLLYCSKATPPLGMIPASTIKKCKAFTAESVGQALTASAPGRAHPSILAMLGASIAAVAVRAIC